MTSIDIEPPLCAICLQSGQLVKVCVCNIYYHKPCITHWIYVKNSKYCEICNNKYKLTLGTKLQLKQCFNNWDWEITKNFGYLVMIALIVFILECFSNRPKDQNSSTHI